MIFCEKKSEKKKKKTTQSTLACYEVLALMVSLYLFHVLSYLTTGLVRVRGTQRYILQYSKSHTLAMQ